MLLEPEISGKIRTTIVEGLGSVARSVAFDDFKLTDLITKRVVRAAAVIPRLNFADSAVAMERLPIRSVISRLD